MRLKDRFRAAVQTFRGAPDLRIRLNTAEYERDLADQTLELSEREREGLRTEIREKNAQLRFLTARTTALSSALRMFSPRLSDVDGMKRFYDAIAPDLDPNGFTLHHTAEKVADVDTVSLFLYEDACGMFETATGRDLMKYLTAYCFDAVRWEIVPGTTHERAVLGEVDTTTPEYQQFERQLYENVLTRMGFEDVLASGQQPGEAAEYHAPRLSAPKMG